MSSLLSRQENTGSEQEQLPYVPANYPFAPQYPESKHPLYLSEMDLSAPQYPEAKHPLYLSEMNPSAPVQHIYYGPQGDAHTPQYRAEPLLLPIKPSNRLLAQRQRVSNPLAQRRQSRKISQRRDDDEKYYLEINRSSAAGKGRSNEPDRSRPQNMSSFVQREGDNKSFEPSKQQETSPRGAKPTSVPISGLLSASSR